MPTRHCEEQRDEAIQPTLSFRDGALAPAPDVQLHIWETRDSRFDAELVIGPRGACHRAAPLTRSHRPGMTAVDCFAEPVTGRRHGLLRFARNDVLRYLQRPNQPDG